ncbi:MAG: hypothetical protein WCC90_06585 [Methylocella sp.]
MSSRLLSGAGAVVIIFAAGHALAAAQDQRFKPAVKPQKASKLVVPVQPAPLGATVESVLAAGRQLNPALRAAALDTSAAAAKAAGADALDDPMISDSYQFYRNPNVFSGHAVEVTQAFPLAEVAGTFELLRCGPGGARRAHLRAVASLSPVWPMTSRQTLPNRGEIIRSRCFGCDITSAQTRLGTHARLAAHKKRFSLWSLYHGAARAKIWLFGCGYSKDPF